ncbi:hypothetical protein DYB32_001339 [Aphanomyces invadans]|uniref:DNA polymerase alpha subunit B n=1 Tax=Aphanomyces invadans TaxID=157072 RepID=A0A418B8A4_9STRA|nr:hypothetical protein DYB32_001339 [Aphanomyces invadans]
MSTTTAADINAAFNNNSLDIKEDAVATCIDLCKEFALSAESLAEQWDVFAMNASIKVATVDSLGKFRAMLFDQANKRSIKRETKETLKSKPMVKKEPIASVYGIQLPTVHDTPKKRQASASFQSPDAKILRTSVFSPSSFQSPPTAEYASRTNAGEVVDSFNTSLKSQIEPAEYRSDSVEVERLHGDKQMSKFVRAMWSNSTIPTGPSANFMYTSMSDRAIALDTLLVDFQTRMEAQLGIEFGAVGDPSPSQVTVCGRIVCEAPEGKLNASVIQLEGARKHCGGQRVLLDLSQVPALEAFPGKASLSANAIPEPLAMVESIANDSAPIRVFTAAGPFTANNDPQYQPLSDLITVAAKQRPDVVILYVESWLSLEEGIAGIFMARVLFLVITKFNTLLAELPNCHLVLIPSVRDVQHPYVYPQPPFDRKKVFEGLDSPDFQKRVHLLSNPTTFTINGTVFGATTSDILLELGGAEFHRSQQAAQQQRLFRLTEQLLRQNSFFPLFPSTGDTPLDLKYIDQYQLPVRLDVLLLPSVLNRFCGAVQDTLCVNPGQLSKGQAGGTYAEITILPKGHHESPEPHQVAQRTLVEVKRI